MLLYKIDMLKFYYSIKMDECPNYFKLLTFDLREDVHSHDTRNKQLLHMPLIRLNYLRRTIRYRIGEVVNNLPKDIISKIETHSINNLISRTKKFVLSTYNLMCTGCYVCT